MSSHANLNASGRYFRGPSWPRVRSVNSKVCLNSGYPPLFIAILLIAALGCLAALVRVVYLSTVDYEIAAWIVTLVGGIGWLVALAALVSMYIQPHLANAREPWVAIDDRSLSLPRFDLSVPRNQIVGFVFLGISIGGAHSMFKPLLAIVHQESPDTPAESILIQFPYDSLALRRSHDLAKQADIPHFGRYGLRVKQASDILEAADTLIQERLIGREKGTA